MAQGKKWQDRQTAVLRDAFAKQRHGALRRCIGFYFTFDEWLNVWVKSGKLNHRGRSNGQYVMARKGDIGPYSAANVEIKTSIENHKEATVGKPWTPARRKAGMPPVSDITRHNLSVAHKGVPWSDARRAAFERGHV